MSGRRVCSLLKKEFLDLRRNRGALLPVLLVAAVTVTLPFVITVVLPGATGEALSSDTDLARVSTVVGEYADLGPESRVQLFLFQQFLLLFLLMPITGAMALAAHAIVGEKQARTLEPLLATPVGTLELLVAKVFGSLLPTLAISSMALVLYTTLLGIVAEPGVLRAMVSARSALLVVLIGPASALVSLQAAIIVSSRVNDVRTAQQFGVLIVVPLTALLVAQFTGTLWLSTRMLAWIGAGLLGVWLLLMLASAVLFDRERILTRWR